MRLENKPFCSQVIKETIKQRSEHSIFRKVWFKYLLMRVRAKISFIAFQKRLTVHELFITAIMKSHKKLMHLG